MMIEESRISFGITKGRPAPVTLVTGGAALTADILGTLTHGGDKDILSVAECRGMEL